MSVSHDIVRLLPYLRRYARALTGSQSTGDEYVRLCLEAILAEPARIKNAADLRVELFAVFHDAWDIVDSAIPEAEGGADETGINRQLAALPSIERQVLLLIALERFSTSETARILDLEEADVVRKLDLARQELRRQATTKVLIIEDEPVIAMDIAGIVESLGHEVIGVAGRQAEAVELARKHQPGLVLADVQLQDGDSGIVTVQEIMLSMDAPVIFVTGFPERLLTGDRVEPAFIVTKPFDPETLKVAIVQALSFSAPRLRRTDTVFRGLSSGGFTKPRHRWRPAVLSLSVFVRSVRSGRPGSARRARSCRLCAQFDVEPAVRSRQRRHCPREDCCACGVPSVPVFCFTRHSSSALLHAATAYSEYVRRTSALARMTSARPEIATAIVST